MNYEPSEERCPFYRCGFVRDSSPCFSNYDKCDDFKAFQEYGPFRITPSLDHFEVPEHFTPYSDEPVSEEEFNEELAAYIWVNVRSKEYLAEKAQIEFEQWFIQIEQQDDSLISYEYEQLQRAEDIGEQESYMKRLSEIISKGDKPSPKDVASIFRTSPDVNIPTEVRQWIADRLEGKPTGRGRPVKIFESAQQAFSEWFEDGEESIRDRFHKLKKQEMKTKDALKQLSREENLSESRIKQFIYPKKKDDNS